MQARLGSEMLGMYSKTRNDARDACTRPNVDTRVDTAKATARRLPMMLYFDSHTGTQWLASQPMSLAVSPDSATMPEIEFTSSQPSQALEELLAGQGPAEMEQQSDREREPTDGLTTNVGQDTAESRGWPLDQQRINRATASKQASNAECYIVILTPIPSRGAGSLAAAEDGTSMWPVAPKRNGVERGARDSSAGPQLQGTRDTRNDARPGSRALVLLEHMALCRGCAILARSPRPKRAALHNAHL
ncbi:hypothetical protein NM208_g14271 [Fusarium decemcellulare]|uniref:Uncharacterized protein n=1 Tax=Fusarium decemcellulare TaxID=57161 RepID=A0ACC1RGN1_9HYPO|nr:hypothetical protein NM208_g14271 [Fusarium decemcellulare]